MQRYIALLGGINVGGHRIKMDYLRELFEKLGFDNVSTFIASGNVIFETGASDVGQLQSQIEQYLLQELGYNVPTLLRSSHELAIIASYQPFPSVAFDPKLHTLSILFLAEELPVEAQSTFINFGTSRDEFHIHQREIYWLCRGKTTETLVDWRRLGKAIALPANTMRNSTTIRKLAMKYAS